MPAVHPPSVVLVTGANGFIASWVCHELLSQQFIVRGTVRDQDKGKYLEKLFKYFGDKFSYVIVNDLQEPGAVAEALKGVDAIAHIASPNHLKITEPYRDLINPTVNGTLALLKSAKAAGNVKRVVLTSSIAAVQSPRDIVPNYLFTDKDWNEKSVKAVEESGDQTEVYRASKVLTEQSAWNFVKNENPGFDLVTICPPRVLGPIIRQVKNLDSLNPNIKIFYNYLTGESDLASKLAPVGHTVDVRDVALAHVQSLLKEVAGGNRYLVVNTQYSITEVTDICVNDQVCRNDWPNARKQNPKHEKEAKKNIYDGSRSEKDLDIKYRPLKAIILDMAKSLKDYSKEW